MLEHGIYRVLMDQYYLTETPIDVNALRLLCIRSSEEVKIAKNLLNEFFIATEDGRYIHKRIDCEISKQKEKSLKAKASASVRWNANAIKSQCERIDKKKPEIIEEDILIKNDSPNCPHEKIIEQYHSILPTLPKVRIWTEARKKQLQARWKSDPEHQTIEFWQWFFTQVSKSSFLLGQIQSGDRKPFSCDLAWLTKQENFVKVIEGRYK